jgi:hypothetical protein
MRSSVLQIVLLALVAAFAGGDSLRATVESTDRAEIALSRTGEAEIDSHRDLFLSYDCPGAKRCFKNPGFTDGYDMYKVVFGKCVSECVAARICFNTTSYPWWFRGIFPPIDVCSGDFSFVLGFKNLLGWQCGKCPSDQAAVAVNSTQNGN